MRTFKLIKEYPSSAKLGARFTTANDSVNETFYSKYPEFYEEVIIPSITTEDNFKCLFGKSYVIYGVDVNNKSFHIITIKLFSEESFYEPGAYTNRKWFINKDNAEHYLIQNKPMLSLKDIASVYVTAAMYDPNDFKSKPLRQSKKLYELVKRKLNII